jgi:peptide chain release factor 2
MPSIINEIKELEKASNKEGFWNDLKNSNYIITKLKKLQKKLNNFKSLEDEIENLISLNELLSLNPDEEMIKEVILNTNKIQTQLEKLEIETLLNGKYDKNNAILTLHPGARRDRITRLGSNDI